MEIILSLLLTLGSQYMQTPQIVEVEKIVEKPVEKIISIDHSETVNTTHEPGKTEYITSAWVCEKKNNKNLCDYKLEVRDQDGEKIIPDLTLIEGAEAYERMLDFDPYLDEEGLYLERMTQYSQFGYVVPGGISLHQYYGDMSGDGVRDILLYFHTGIEMYNAVAIDVKNRKVLGCIWSFAYFDKFEETKGGGINYFASPLGDSGEWVILGPDYFPDRECSQLPM